MPFEERRRYPRSPESIPCHLWVGSSPLAVETENISCGGALAQVPEPIPLMTKLRVSLYLPASEEKVGQWIQCSGVVVRHQASSQPDGSPAHRIAIYFSQIKLEDRRRIAEFVLKSMLAHDRRRS